MKKLLTICAVVGLILGVAGAANANTFTLEFSPNDLLNYSLTDGTRLNQQGIARRFEHQTRTDSGSPWGLAGEYTTYSDGRPIGQNATDDIANVASAYGACTLEYQGISQIQLWLRGGITTTWGETVVQKPSAGQNLTISTDGAGGWSTGSSVQVDVDGGYDSVVFNHDGNPATDPWLNGSNLMSETFSVTGDFYVDENDNGIYDDGIDSDLVEGTDYTLWFYAPMNNCYFEDAYNSGSYINTGVENEKGAMEGTIPEPATMGLLVLGGLFLLRRRSK